MDSYVSSTLRHFVGRSLANDDDRFDLLTKIISEGKLRANIKILTNLLFSQRGDMRENV